MNRPKKCKVKGPCFARGEGGVCEILTDPPARVCTFQKEDGMVTNGKLYPFNQPTGNTAYAKMVLDKIRRGEK